MGTEVWTLRDVRPVPDPVFEYDCRGSAVPLVIDNGSYRCRADWATRPEPRLDFKSLIAKPRKEKGKKDESALQIGNDVANVEAVRFQLKTQFDRNVVTHFQAQEQVFDHIFHRLGIDTAGRVRHPVLVTEAFANPNRCRQLMSELLFECYGVPSVAYGVGSLFAFRHNRRDGPADTGLVLDMGFHSVHVIPVLKGKAAGSRVRRINVGGFQMTAYLHRLLQLKYPAHLNAITPSRAEELLHDHCRVALHYREELKRWTSPEHYEANVRKIQLPYAQPQTVPALSSEAQKERKREMARRLIEINARKREEKLAEDEEQLNRLSALQDMLDDGDCDEFYRAIRSFGIKDEDDLARQINRLNGQIDKVRQKIAAASAAENDPNFTANEEKQASNSSKIQPPIDPQQFNNWLQDLRKRKTDIIETRVVRKQRKLDMAKRRTAAAQERMRIISELAKKEKGIDDFGMRDEDWDVYKTISRDGNDSDSDTENEKLLEIDEALREYDPQFVGNEGSEIGLSEAHQLHLAIERIRAPELMFQPFMIGNIEAGLAETIEYVLKQFDPSEQLELANNVFVTGGCANFPGLKERLSRELLEMRPFQTPHTVNMAKNYSLDAWYGARSFALGSQFKKCSITKKEYNEMGGDYLKEHYASNKYCPTPVYAYSSADIKEEPIDI